MQSTRIPLLLFASIAAMLVCFASAVPAQTVVTPDNLASWLIGPFGTPPTADFVLGADTPPLGSGSYATEIIVANSKIILARNDYHDQPLSSLTALSYWTYIDPLAANTNNWYVNLYLDADGDGAWDTRLDYVPPPAMVTAGIWQLWDAHVGVWDSTGGPTTLADFLIANPNARINAFDTPLGGAIRFNMGDTASSYVGFIGNLDAVRIAVSGVGDETWDFELFGAVQEVPALSPVGLLLLIAGLMVAAAGLLRRTRRVCAAPMLGSSDES